MYRILYRPAAVDHLAELKTSQRREVTDAIREQLEFQPVEETRNRKPMHEFPLGAWSLRVGDMRVYYDVEEDPEPIVYVRAVGIKDRERILVAGEVVWPLRN